MDNGIVLFVTPSQISFKVVLILVVVDNGLVLRGQSLTTLTSKSLNPCCSGQWSRTCYYFRYVFMFCFVLILVVVDNGLVRNLALRQVSMGAAS